jgi:hypothetical protein
MYKIEEFSGFKGGWSLCDYEVYICFKYITYVEKINILEFGAGDGTEQMMIFLNKNNIKFNYISVEHDSSFANTLGVEYRLYSHPNWRQDDNPWNYNPELLENVELNLGNTIFDFVIVDGPNGVGRAKWYKKFKNNIREGTILLIDDFHHYKEFGDELNINFEYELINVFNQDDRFEIQNEGLEKVDTSKTDIMYNSCFKIIKIKNIK